MSASLEHGRRFDKLLRDKQLTPEELFELMLDAMENPDMDRQHQRRQAEYAKRQGKE